MSGESAEVMFCSIKRGSTTSQNYSSLGRRHRYVVTDLRLGQYNEETRPTKISMLALQTPVVPAMCTVSWWMETSSFASPSVDQRPNSSCVALTAGSSGSLERILGETSSSTNSLGSAGKEKKVLLDSGLAYSSSRSADMC